jgi:GT2 family glycosyltransferase
MIYTLKKTIRSLWYFISNANYRLVKKSLCFDSSFYLKTYPDVATSEVDPLLHYLTVGFAEPRQPSALFDISYYLKQVPDLIETSSDPLIHFLLGGWREGVKPNLLFDPLWYAQENSGVDFTRINPLTHFLKQGGQGVTSLYFDPAYYRAEYNDVEPNVVPLVDFFLVGTQEKRRPSLYFDTAWYLDKNPVLFENEMDPLAHYFYFGIEERKSPSPLFDPDYYVETYNVNESGDLFAHYVEHGAPLEHKPCRWFDPAFYRERYLEQNITPTAPIDHYLTIGVQVGCYPNKDVADLSAKPIISILVPVYNVTPSHLNNCIRSILYQSYPHWELCVADDCSTREDVRPLLEQWAAQDCRIKITFLDKNLGISGATNAAAMLSTGSYLGFLDNDDELTPDCLLRVVQKINSEEADLYYSDEDLIGEDGRQFNIFNKPGFNKELLLSHNYITHFVVTEKTLYDKVGGLDSALDGAQDFDLFLKLSEQAKMIVHIPEILYHWRASETSTSINHDQKQYANEAGRKAVENALGRRGMDAAVEHLEWKFYYRGKRKLASYPLVSICILYRKNDIFQENLTNLISSTVYPDVEFLIVNEDAGQVLPLNSYNSDKNKKVTIFSIPGNNTPAALYNETVRQSRGQYIVFLNSYVQIQQKDWIQAMLEYGLDDNVGMVGGRLLPVAGAEEFVSTVPDMAQQSALYYARFLQESSRHLVGLQWAQNVFALSWNFAMIKREYFLELGGFDEKYFGNLFADSDLCFRIQEQGKEILYTPFALGHYLKAEEQQPGFDQDAINSEKRLFQKHWQEKLGAGDPYYNLNVLDRNGVKEKEFLTWYLGQSRE